MSKFLYHAECPKCKSSDALALYEQDDSRQQGKCFSCEYYIYDYSKLNNIPKVIKMNSYVPKLTMYDIQQCPYADKRDRKINDETVKLFEVRSTINTVTGVQDAHFYPYYIKGQLSGYKSRVLPKDFTALGAIGNIKGCDFFGQNLCTPGSFKILIVEGEEDAMAAYRMLSAYAKSKNSPHKPNVVSLINGASSAVSEIERSMPFLSTFKEILLCFDKDKAGEQALSGVAALLSSDKFKVVKISEKDCSDMLIKGKQQEFISAFFNAEIYRPDGSISIKDLHERMPEGEPYKGIYYPSDWVLMNKYTYGKRLGDFDVFTAGTGCGKTQFFREMIYSDLFNSNYKIGVLSLEESVEETLNGIKGLHVNKRIHLPDVALTLTKSEKDKIYEDLIKDNRIEFYDHRGQGNERNVLAQIRYMVAVQGCKHIYVDHIGMIVGRSSNHELNQQVDNLMNSFRNLAQELKIWIGCAAHLRKTSKEGMSFEQGAMPSIDDIKGSGGIKNIANAVYFFQRNGQHSIESMKDVICIHIFKSRYVGKQGEADFFRFDHVTGRIAVIPKPEYDIIEKKKRTEKHEEESEF